MPGSRLSALLMLAMPVWGMYSVLLKRRPGEAAALGVLYMGIGASVLAFFFWNRDVK